MSPYFKDYKGEAIAYRQKWIADTRKKRAKAREKAWATRFEFIAFLILACYVTSNLAFWIYTGRVFFGG